MTEFLLKSFGFGFYEVKPINESDVIHDSFLNDLGIGKIIETVEGEHGLYVVTDRGLIPTKYEVRLMYDNYEELRRLFSNKYKSRIKNMDVIYGITDEETNKNF